jgi:hypothetical protein
MPRATTFHWFTPETAAIGRPEQQLRWHRIEPNACATLKAQERIGFAWRFTIAPYLFMLEVRFTDDAGLHWQIDRSLHLQKLDKRDW